MKSALTTLAITAAMSLPISAHAGTLENLERERALLVDTFLDPNLSSAERQAKVAQTIPRLVDMERMVLRDDNLKGRNTPTVRKAFANYDLTFLVHASAEKNRSPFDTWLEQVGLTTEAVNSARVGRRY